MIQTVQLNHSQNFTGQSTTSNDQGFRAGRRLAAKVGKALISQGLIR
jgi:hypothetical protein